MISVIVLAECESGRGIRTGSIPSGGSGRALVPGLNTLEPVFWLSSATVRFWQAHDGKSLLRHLPYGRDCVRWRARAPL